MGRLQFVQGPDGAVTTPLVPVSRGGRESAFAALPDMARRFAESAGFKGEPGEVLLLPDAGGAVSTVLVGVGADDALRRDPLSLGRLAERLPPGDYRLEADGVNGDPARIALGLALGAYRFSTYRQAGEPDVRVHLPAGVAGDRLEQTVRAVTRVRDLVNTPANALAPSDLAAAAEGLAAEHGATVRRIEGDALAEAFPLVAAVGMASERPPVLIDLVHGREDAPKVTLVGKGVVFDTGGLDIKPAAGMLNMKKDMGGAATALGLADMVIGAGIDVRLRVLIPAVENSISGRAFRPGDVFRSRKGLHVEIGNTDAEGRLVLADALALADEESPDLLVSLATLTGAARVALGPDLPPFYTDDEALAADISAAAEAEHDPLWRLPLWAPYDRWLDSKVADLNNVNANGFAGSIVAALFLRRFVEKAKSFAHFDIFAWVPSARAHAPEGGEAQAMRALFHLIEKRHGRA